MGMIGKRGSLFVVLLYGILLSACQVDTSSEELSGRATLWHSWSPAEAVVLEQALAEFQELHPNVQVITTAFPDDQIFNEYLIAAKEGLGPTLLLGHDSWIGDLADAGIIQPLSADLTALELFNTRNLAITQYEGRQYGLPMALAPRALYYNKSIVSSPPTTLDELLQEAAEGHSVAFVPRFTEAYWGIQLFGEGLFDDQARFTLAESGFTEWLDWLNEAQNAPGVIMNIDDKSLLTLFASGEVVYYVAGPEAQAQIKTQTDEENSFEIGVAPLPGQAEHLSGPLLPAEIIMFYTFASQDEKSVL